jgi:hypothetical protein
MHETARTRNMHGVDKCKHSGEWPLGEVLGFRREDNIKMRVIKCSRAISRVNVNINTADRQRKFYNIHAP